MRLDFEGCVCHWALGALAIGWSLPPSPICCAVPRSCWDSRGCSWTVAPAVVVAMPRLQSAAAVTHPSLWGRCPWPAQPFCCVAKHTCVLPGVPLHGIVLLLPLMKQHAVPPLRCCRPPPRATAPTCWPTTSSWQPRRSPPEPGRCWGWSGRSRR